MYYQQAFIKHLKNYRKVNHLTQDELAEVLNYSPKSIDNWEKGLAMPPLEVLFDLAHRMKVSLDQLLGQDQTTLYEQTCHYILQQHRNDKKTLSPVTSDRLVSYIFRSFIFRFSKHPELHEGNLGKHAMYHTYETEIMQYLAQNHYLTSNPKLKLGPKLFDECCDRYESYLKNNLNDTQAILHDKSTDRATIKTKKADLKRLQKALDDLTAIKKQYSKQK